MEKKIGGVFAAALALVALPAARAETFHTAYMFTSNQDGGQPHEVVQDSLGNLYGTTFKGGGNIACDCGTVFRIAPDGTKTTLYAFKGQKDGAHPLTGVTVDGAGNLYGTTNGTSDNLGTVFKLDTGGTLTTLFTFKKFTDGDSPSSAPILDKKGNLYGTTFRGGHISRGTVYKIAPDGKQTVLHSFEGTTRDGDGDNPTGALIADGAGTMYGTTYGGGSNICGDWGCCATPGCGTVFKITPKGVFTILYRFLGNPDGRAPVGALARDHAGNLYGATQQGGNVNAGTLFKLKPDGTKSILYSFHPSTGSVPNDGPVLDRHGNLYGPAMAGTQFSGVIYKLTAGGTYKVLHEFSGGADGKYPTGSLFQGAHGDLFGATTYGGIAACDGINPGCGTVFRIER